MAPAFDSTRDDTERLIRCVALDMDGLLFDTERLYWEVGDTVLRRRGHRYSAELQQRMMGRVGVAALNEMIRFHELTDSPEDLLAESDELYGNLLASDITPMPGLEDWIGHMKSIGVPFGLATSSRRKFVDIIFAGVPWRDDLSFVLTGDDVTDGKPHPEMYLKAVDCFAKLFSKVNSAAPLEASQMMVLEDSGNGLASAVAAGTYAVAIPSVHTRGQNFSGAKLVADSLSDPRLWSLLDTASRSR